MAVVIGREAFEVPESSAMDYVLGFTVAHDVSARDWQLKRNGGQWLTGKAMKAFCPLGESISIFDDLHSNFLLFQIVSYVILSKLNSFLTETKSFSSGFLRPLHRDP